MTEDNRRHNIELELGRASQDLQDARLLREAASYASALAKAYYSMFHHARALLLVDGLEARSHSGVIHLVNLHFVRAGRLSPDVARFLAQHEKLRQDADYDTAAVFSLTMADEAITVAQTYSDAIREILRGAGYLER